MNEKKQINNKAAEKYTAPHIEIIDIEMQQNILGGSVPEMPPTVW